MLLLMVVATPALRGRCKNLKGNAMWKELRGGSQMPCCTCNFYFMNVQFPSRRLFLVYCYWGIAVLRHCGMSTVCCIIVKLFSPLLSLAQTSVFIYYGCLAREHTESSQISEMGYVIKVLKSHKYFFLFRQQTFKTLHSQAGKVAQWFRSTCWSCRGLMFSSKHPHDNLQPLITSAVGDLVSSSDAFQNQASIGCTSTQVTHIQMCRKTFMHITIK